MAHYITVTTIPDPDGHAGAYVTGPFSSSPVTLGSLEMNAYDVNGSKWQVFDLAGWGGTGSTIEVVQKPRQAGAWAGLSYDTARTLVVTGQIVSETPEILNDALDTLVGSVSNGPFVMQVSESGRVRWVTVRKSDEVLVQKVNNRIARFSVQVVALDPRKFGAQLTGDTRLPSSTGGLTIPFTVPFSINSVVVPGQVNLVNPGNETGPVVLRIDGPCNGPVITHVSSGLALRFASQLVLGAGEWLEVDMEKKLTLANGQASRNGYITSRGWSGFTPGPNTWSFTAASYHPAAKLTVTASPSWK